MLRYWRTGRHLVRGWHDTWILRVLAAPARIQRCKRSVLRPVSACNTNMRYNSLCLVPERYQGGTAGEDSDANPTSLAPPTAFSLTPAGAVIDRPPPAGVPH